MNRHMKKIFIFVILIIICLFPIFAQGATETQSLVTDVESDDIYTLMKVYHFLDLQIQKIEDDFNSMLDKENLSIKQHYTTLLTEIDSLKPELWETDVAFGIRTDKLKDSLNEEKVVALAEAKEDSDVKRIGPKNIYIDMLNQVIPAIRQERVIEDTYLKIEPQEYLRNERKWPISIKSTNPDNDFANLIAFVDFYEHTNDEKEIRQQIIDFSQAVETNALSASVQWDIELDGLNNRFVFVTRSVSVKNNLNDLVYRTIYPEGILTNAYIVEGNSYIESTIQPTALIVDASITENRFALNVPIDIDLDFSPKNVIEPLVILQVEDLSLFEVMGHTIKALEPHGTTNLILTDKRGLFIKTIALEIVYNVGDLGPAGGYVFYDAGDYSRGWRYMEVAPEDIYDWAKDKSQSWIGSDETEFFVETDTAIGSGKQNTIDIASSLKHKDSAAQLCLDYEHGGYKDWFLPSIDELDVLTKMYGDSLLVSGFTYWSSSMEEKPSYGIWTKAWYQYADFLSREKNLKAIFHTTPSIRPIRYF